MPHLTISRGLRLAGFVLAGAAIVTACDSGDDGVRKIAIAQQDGGCVPASVQVAPGETVKFVVTNSSSYELYEMEGGSGLSLDEFVVPKGASRERVITVPEGARNYTLDCYVPSGVRTEVQLVAGGAVPNPTAPTNERNTRTSDTPVPSAITPDSGTEISTSVAVTLIEYSVTVDKPSVPPGTIRFIATNVSATQTHQMVVMRVAADGAFEQLAETDGIAPEQGGSLTLQLTPGLYRLACLIDVGEFGSTVNHLQQGMQTDFIVR